MTAEAMVRRKQLRHERFGLLYERMYEFAGRTAREYFPDVVLPEITLSFETDRVDRLGWYAPEDAMGLKHRINLNPKAIRDGCHAAEVLAHEMLHCWEYVTGTPTLRNEHTDSFNERMFGLFGIRSEGPQGRHTAHDERWDGWLQANADLNLDSILFPGSERKDKRKMIKHTCLTCGATFHARKAMNVICGDCAPNWSDYETAKFLVTESGSK